MSSIFISYSRQDSEVAKDLKLQLENSHFTVWLDVAEIESGDQWKERILSGIEKCSAVVVILTPRSARSHWVMRELTYAIEFKKPIFPLLLEGELWPLVSDYHCAKSSDELIRGLRRLAQIVVCRVPEDEAFGAKLTHDLAELGANLRQGDPDDLEKLKTNHIMLLVVSPESMTSSSIRTLWTAFDELGKSIIPLVIRHTHVPTGLRDKHPYIDFYNQDYQIAFLQLCSLLDSLGANLVEHENIPIPAQPPLPLDRSDMLLAARQEIWICGLVLDIIEGQAESLKSALKSNPLLKIRLLTLELNVELANETGAWVGINEARASRLPSNPQFEEWSKRQHKELSKEGLWIAKRLYDNQETVSSLQAQFPDRISLHTVTHRLGMGYFIVDPNAGEKQGMLTASPYFYQIDPLKAVDPLRNNTPTFLSKSSSRKSDLWWFDQYVQEFERLWKNSKPYHRN
jgi:hypothetical protein